MLQKDKFQWSQEAQVAFDQLKKKMTEAPILVSPDFSIAFTVETDAFALAMGAVLMQNSHPISYYSKVLCPRLQCAFAYVRELHAITVAVRKWRHYLFGHTFTILTDYRSLKELVSHAIQTPGQQIYLSKLLGYDYVIQYKSSPQNIVVDTLSRLPTSEAAQLYSLSMPNFVFLDQL